MDIDCVSDPAPEFSASIYGGLGDGSDSAIFFLLRLERVKAKNTQDHRSHWLIVGVPFDCGGCGVKIW